MKVWPPLINLLGNYHLIHCTTSNAHGRAVSFTTQSRFQVNTAGIIFVYIVVIVVINISNSIT